MLRDSFPAGWARALVGQVIPSPGADKPRSIAPAVAHRRVCWKFSNHVASPRLAAARWASRLKVISGPRARHSGQQVAQVDPIAGVRRARNRLSG